MLWGATPTDLLSLALLSLLAARDFGRFWQRTADTGVVTTRALADLERKHDREIAELKLDLADQETLRKQTCSDTAQRFSKNESKLDNLHTELRKYYVLKEVCEALTAKEHTHRGEL